jgi:hypothetical protein
MEVMGYAPGLLIEDVEWLLADAPTRTAEHERRLAIDAAMMMWRRSNGSADLLARIESVAHTDPSMSQVYNEWTQPQAPSPELRKSERELRKAQRRNAIAEAKRDKSWIDFVNQLREGPEPLSQFRPTSSEGADRRLFHLWQLLRAALGNRPQFAIDTLAPLEPILGAELARVVHDGIIAHWRAWEPRLRSARDLQKRSEISNLDCMGIAGVTLESKTSVDWAERLSAAEAKRAAEYATLEINGFPEWLADLTRAKPEEVLSVLRAEVEAEIANAEPGRHCEVLYDLTRADARTQQLLALSLLEALETRTDFLPTVLSPILEVLSRNPGEHRDRFVRLALDRFNREDDPTIASNYLGALVTIDAEAAAGALLAKLATIDGAGKTPLAICALPRLFGHHLSSETRPILSFEILERLVGAACASRMSPVRKSLMFGCAPSNGRRVDREARPQASQASSSRPQRCPKRHFFLTSMPRDRRDHLRRPDRHTSVWCVSSAPHDWAEK